MPNAVVGTLSAVDPDLADTHTFSLIDSLGFPDNLAFSLAGNTLSLNASANFETKPGYSIRVVATDNGTPPRSVTNTVAVSIQNVNEMPFFVAGGNRRHPALSSGAQSVTGWATSVSDGDATATQSITFNVSASGAALFSTAPAVDASGNLTYTLNGSSGVANLSVTLTDDATLVGAALTTNPQTFTITVDPAPNYVVTVAPPLASVQDMAGAAHLLELREVSAGTFVFASNGSGAGVNATFSLNGALNTTGASSSFTLAGVNQVVMNAGAGADTIRITSAFAASVPNLPSVEINGGTEDDILSFTQDLQFAAGASLVANFQDDHATPGFDQVQINSGVNIVTSGSGQIDIRVSGPVSASAGGSLESVDGAIRVEANRQTTPSTGSFSGVFLQDADVLCTGAGAIDILGRSGGGFSYNLGVNVRQGSRVAGGTGAVTINGVGSSSANLGQFGVAVNGAGSVITSSGGNVSVTGNGGGSGSAPTQVGVAVEAGGEISAGGTGSLTVMGTGGPVTSGGNNHGVWVEGATSRITTIDGDLSVTGTGGGSVDSPTNAGVYVNQGRILAGGSGRLDVTGSSGWLAGTQGQQRGVILTGSTARLETANGPLTVTGTARSGAGVSSNHGVEVSGSVLLAGGVGALRVEGRVQGDGGGTGVSTTGATTSLASSGGDVTVLGFGGGSGPYNIGVWVSQAIITGPQAGATLTVTGTGGASTDSYNQGVEILSSGRIQGAGGNVAVTGTGGANSSRESVGISMLSSGQITATGAGSITLTGTAGASSTAFLCGVWVRSNGLVQTDDGIIRMEGSISGNSLSSTSRAVVVDGGQVVAGGSGDVVVVADSVTLGGQITATGDDLFVRTRTAGVPVDIGGADLFTGSSLRLGLTDAELDAITADRVVVGDANSGAIQLTGAISPLNYPLLRVEQPLTFTSSGSFRPDLFSGSAYERIEVDGAVAIQPGAQLLPSMQGGYSPDMLTLLPLVVNVSGAATSGAFLAKPEGSVITVANFSRRATITYLGNPGGNDVVLAIVNNEPGFTAGPGQTVFGNAGPQTVPGWASAIDDGDPNLAQGLSFHVIGNSNPGVLTGTPAVDPDGTLHYAPALNACGDTTITLELRDDAGTAFGGDDTSVARTFVIQVLAPEITVHRVSGLEIQDAAHTADFGQVVVAGCVVRKFIIGNTCNYPLTNVVAVLDTGSTFTIIPPLVAPSIAPGAHGLVHVRYCPSGPNVDADTLRLLTNDPDEPSFEIGLVGEGFLTDAPLVCSPSALTNHNGVVHARAANDSTQGQVLASGDVNGDEVDDLVIAFPLGDVPPSRTDAGVCVVYFGGVGADAVRDLAGTHGSLPDVVIQGPAYSSKIGLEGNLLLSDLNGDCILDIVLGAPLATTPAPGPRPQGGVAYLLVGRTNWTSTVDLAAPGAAVKISGANTGEQLTSGGSLASADFTGDGIPDLALGATWAGGPVGAPTRPKSGRAYLVRGRASWPAALDLRTQADLTVYGAGNDDQLSEHGALALGDVNGDGRADLVVAAQRADGPGNSRSSAGEAYVVLGRTLSVPTVIDLAAGQQDQTILGATATDLLTQSGALAVGDLDGDGRAEIVLGAAEGDGPANARVAGGEAAIVPGTLSLAPVVDLATAGGYIPVVGANSGDRLTAGGALLIGDVTGDGLADLILGAEGARGPLNARTSAGEAYVINGRAEWPASIDLAVPPADTLTVYGPTANDRLTRFGGIALGDLNVDGIQDLLLGADAADGLLDALPTSGEAFVVFGAESWPAPTRDLFLPTDGSFLTLRGGAANDELSKFGALIAGDTDGDGAPDLFAGAPGVDGPSGAPRANAGAIHRLRGKPGALDCSRFVQLEGPLPYPVAEPLASDAPVLDWLSTDPVLGAATGLWALPGFTYVLEASPNLRDWSTVDSTTVPEPGLLQFSDPRAAHADRCYYRVRRE